MNEETILLFAKDFFGDALDARITFYRDERPVLSTAFRDGYAAIRIPHQLEPGLYDVVAEREGASYRIESLFVPLASDLFYHADMHGDLSLKGGNFSGPPIERHKVDPIFYDYLARIPSDFAQRLSSLVSRTGEQSGLRAGGRVTLLGSRLLVGGGEAYVSGRMVSWGDAEYDLGERRGKMSLGIRGDDLVLDGDAKDFEIASISIDSQDYIRLVLKRRCHPVARSGSLYYLERVLRDSAEMDYGVGTGRVLSGLVRDDLVYGPASYGGPVSEVSLEFHGEGPVLSTDRLYLYAESDYFLLWEGGVLIAVVPRYSGRVRLAWGDGVILESQSESGQVSVNVAGAYSPSAVRLMEGPIASSYEEDVGKKRYEMEVLASDQNIDDWTVRYRTSSASLFWDDQDISAQTVPSDNLLPSDTLLPQ